MAPSDTPGTDKGFAATALVTAVVALILATVYVAQYGFDLFPCTLCFVQRVPYWLAVVMGTLSLMRAVDSRTRRVILFHLAGLFLLDAGIALYHAGVEFHWWAGPVTCTGGARILSLDDLTSALGKKGHPNCDEPAFLFMGISMAGYNVFAALGLTVASVFAATRKTWWNAS